jgi:hypothetical protein
MEQLYSGGVRKFNECESSKVRQMKCNFVVSPAANGIDGRKGGVGFYVIGANTKCQLLYTCI